jgi:ATP-dependent DNA helicase DinG
MLTPGELLGRDGPLADLITDFAPRPQQQEMAQTVAEALENDAVLVTEAGTGTGKTFAYLVPALMSGGKVIISTATKTLQDQLFHRDIPVVRQALKVPVSIALLKGRANYLCLHRLSVSESSGLLPSINYDEYVYGLPGQRTAISLKSMISPKMRQSGIR